MEIHMSNDSHLKVINGGAQVSGSKNWSEGVRDEARSLAGKLDEGYMELAKLLYTIWDTPIDGDPKNGPVFTQWGYVSFADYVEQELGIHRKKAQRLKAVWYGLEVRLKDSLDPALKKRIIALGFSKVRELVGQLTARNAEKWVEKAEELSYPKLCIAVRKYREDREQMVAEHTANREAIIEAGGDPDADLNGEGGDGGDGGDGLPEAVDSVIGEPLVRDEPPEPEVPDGDFSDLVRENFNLYPDQHDTVKEALAIAQKLSNSTVKSNNLHLVCLDFVATNGEGKTTAAQRMKRLVQLGKSYGLDLVILDEGDVVFGLDNLQALADKANEEGS
jgi:hypothetical protein